MEFMFVMPIPRNKQKELRQIALSIVWQVIDAATREIDLQRIDGELSDDEACFVAKIIDSKAQRAFVEYDNYKTERKA